MALTQEIKEQIDDVCQSYLNDQVGLLLSVGRTNSRVSYDDLKGILGRAQAAKELHAHLRNRLGYDSET